jgi:class 3 adenylate cyclase
VTNFCPHAGSNGIEEGHCVAVICGGWRLLNCPNTWRALALPPSGRAAMVSPRKAVHNVSNERQRGHDRMSVSATVEFEREAAARLKRAEEQGLRLAIAVRTLITGLAFCWYVATPVLFSGFEPRIAAIIVLLLFTLVGVAHLAVIGTTYDRWWMKYAVYSIDIVGICATFALIPISRAEEIPQIIAFRAYGIYYLFPIVAMSCLCLSWRLVIWTGLMCVISWWGTFLWVTMGMGDTLSWADIPAEATRADYETIFLSMNFIGRGNRIEETTMIFCAALALALAVYRARAVFFAQVASELDWRRERDTRERVSNLLGKYVPAEVAERMISTDAPLAPQQTEGTALVLDIAGFTGFSVQHTPDHVISVLDQFFADATDAVTREHGVVITYLGDGFLVTFNAPVREDRHAEAALRAVRTLQAVATSHGFEIRIGIASGPLVTGTVGSEARQSFTVYGNPVNLASRLEGLAKTLEASVLLDRSTQVQLGTEWPLAHAGDYEIDGIDGTRSIYRLENLKA